MTGPCSDGLGLLARAGVGVPTPDSTAKAIGIGLRDVNRSENVILVGNPA
jgi:hypothetical protein